MVPWEVIPRVYSADLSMADLCALHGWSELENPRHVFDAVLFSVELDLLEIRLMELLPVVTKFLIVESNTTFTGIPKPLVFQENRSRFAFAEDKIEYAMVAGRTLQKGEDPFDLERRQRVAMNALFDKLRGRGELRDGDVVIMADVDEIPARETSQLLRSCGGLPPVLHLGMRNYIYSFDFMVDTDHWRAKAHVVAPNANGLQYSHSRASNVLLADAGWHCSFCFRRLSDFVFKMTGYSHADRARGAAALDAQRIQRVVCDGSDIFGMMPEAYSFKDLVWKWGPTKPLNSLVNVPRHLVAGARLGRFKFLLPGGCIREP
ncbi:hypothetical protein HK405_003564 [Cladochytrium tenue]|nr:hypothetical protein HK405_003564 [Cladochytrium tenue]